MPKICQNDRIQRCVVFGGEGFIGSHLVDALLARGVFVRCFDRPSADSRSMVHQSNAGFEVSYGDFGNSADVATALEDCEICIHLISGTIPTSSNADPIFDIQSNLVSTVQMLKHAVRIGVRRVVFVSSGGTVYGNPLETPISESHPTNPTCSYGINKLAIEKYLILFRHLYGLNYSILRVANPYGERQRLNGGQGAVAVFLGKILRNEPIEIWGDGSIVRDYLHISDVVNALICAMGLGNQDCILNFGSGHGVSVNRLLDVVENVTGRLAIRQYSASRRFDVPINVLCIDNARKMLGWTPSVSFEDGVDRFYRWLTQNDLLAQ